MKENIMKIKVDELVNPTIGDLYCLPGHFSTKGNPTPTGNWAMRGQEILLIELEFTHRSLLSYKQTTKEYVNSNFIKLEEEIKYFSCSQKGE